VISRLNWPTISGEDGTARSPGAVSVGVDVRGTDWWSVAAGISVLWWGHMQEGYDGIAPKYAGRGVYHGAGPASLLIPF